MKQLLTRFVDACMVHEEPLRELDGFIRWMDSLEWETQGSAAVFWRTTVVKPFFRVSLEVSLCVYVKERNAYKSLDRKGVISSGDQCCLNVHFSCSDVDNPWYLKYKERFGGSNHMVLSSKEEFTKARQYVSSIIEFFEDVPV